QDLEPPGPALEQRVFHRDRTCGRSPRGQKKWWPSIRPSSLVLQPVLRSTPGLAPGLALGLARYLAPGLCPRLVLGLVLGLALRLALPWRWRSPPALPGMPCHCRLLMSRLWYQRPVVL